LRRRHRTYIWLIKTNKAVYLEVKNIHYSEELSVFSKFMCPKQEKKKTHKTTYKCTENTLQNSLVVVYMYLVVTRLELLRIHLLKKWICKMSLCQKLRHWF
jgi:hypothetical protein